MACTYKLTDTNGKAITLKGEAAIKAYLADGNLERLIPSEGAFVRKFDQTKTESFKRWSNNARLITSLDAVTHAFRTGEKVVLEAFHGTQRPDRIGELFKKSRATSGPMAFHTSSPELASGYARGKKDTSLSNEEQHYAHWFKFKPQGSRSTIDIDRAWYFLDSATKAKIADIAPKLRSDDDGNLIRQEDNRSGNGSYDYQIKESRGNALHALVEDWLSSGHLFNKEEQFMQVLKAVGLPMKDIVYDSPHSEYPFVFKNYIEMQKPLVAYDIPQEVVSALDRAAKTDRSRAGLGGADSWDKRNRTLRDWVEEFHGPNNEHVWSSIPDKVTDVLRSLGYDGIIDVSGKNGGDKHPVYIPFEETQVKSAIGNKGTFDVMKKSILKSTNGSVTTEGKVTREAIQSIADQYNKKLRGNAEVVVLRKEEGLPEGLRQIKDDKGNEIEGAYIGGGKAYIMADAFDSIQRVHEVINHELSHLAAEELLDSKEYQAGLKSVQFLDDGGNATIRKLGQEVDRRQPGLSAENRNKEILALSVENGTYKNIPTLQRVVADITRSFKAALRKLGLNNEWVNKLSEREVFSMMRGAMDSLYEKGESRATKEIKPALASTERKTFTYSQLTRAIEGAADRFFGKSGNEIGVWLKSNAAKLGIKADEMQWSGVEDWLKLQGKNKVSKAEVLDYLEQGGVKVQDVVLGRTEPKLDPMVTSDEITVTDASGHQWELSTPDGRSLRVGKGTVDFGDDAKAYGVRYFNGQAKERNREREAKADTSKFSKYVLPGGENYKELLLTLPLRTTSTDYVVVNSSGEIQERFGSKSDAENYANQRRDMRVERDAVLHSSKDSAPFRSSHFDQPNILAHIRFNERTDANGKKVLFIEEVQSDWGQKGKKEGFNKIMYRVVGRGTGNLAFSSGDNHPSREAAEQSIAEDRVKYPNAYRPPLEIIESPLQSKIPTAPFVTETNAWTTLALKRMIRYAADNGFDKIAWANGEQNAAHYDLSKKISEVHYSGTNLKAYDHKGKTVVNETGVHEKDLADYIGKEAAQKLIDAPKNGTLRSVSGLDLKVGGEGMKTFYDEIVPQVANTILKKFGGRVGEVEFAGKGGEKKIGRQMGFDITPEMKEKLVTEGLPLFSKKSPKEDIRDTYEASRKFGSSIFREASLFANPMGTGNSDRAKMETFKYANDIRKAQWQWVTIQDKMTKDFAPDRLERMWDAADEENEIRSGRMEKSPDKGIESLEPKERQTVEELHQYGEELLQAGMKVGMFEHGGVPYWSPRTAYMIGEDGAFAPFSLKPNAAFDATEAGPTTTSPNEKHRTRVTAEQTEAAIKSMGGEGIIHDIRAMPIAMARLERAIAGRELINRIREYGELTGQEIVAESDKDGHPNYFTIDHPAFKTYKDSVPISESQLEKDGYTIHDGKVWQPIEDMIGGEKEMKDYRVNDDGSIDHITATRNARKIYIDKEWEGPLKAVLEQKLPMEDMYKGLMNAKVASMNLIMASPLIHGMVIYGRAVAHGVPLISGTYAYWQGHKAAENTALMREMIDHGLVPMGRNAFMQDITGLMEASNLKGNSIISRAVGDVVGRWNEQLGVKAVKGIDKFFDFYHNTLLWNRIADLQMGIYLQEKAALIKSGENPDAAAYMAAHVSNRFAGAIPAEAISKSLRALMNVTFFSRSFQQANIGVMKDAFVGLPAAQYSTIKLLHGELVAESLKSRQKKQAWGMIVKDFALAYIMNNLLQAGLQGMLKEDEDGKPADKLSSAFAENYKRMLHEGTEGGWKGWSNWLNPYFVPDSLSLLSQNEPDRQNRIRVGTEQEGTAIYMRNPMGKVVEEVHDWMLHPGKTLSRKLSQMVKGPWQAVTNDQGLGKIVYKEDDPAGEKFMLSLQHIVEAFIPVDAMKAHKDMLLGNTSKPDESSPWFMPSTPEGKKVFGFWLGLSTSHGAPGGPEIGEARAIEKRHNQGLDYVSGQVKELVKKGKIDEAMDLYEQAGATPREAVNKIKRLENPELSLKGLRKKVGKYASDEELSRMSAVGGL